MSNISKARSIVKRIRSTLSLRGKQQLLGSDRKETVLRSSWRYHHHTTQVLSYNKNHEFVQIQRYIVFKKVLITILLHYNYITSCLSDRALDLYIGPGFESHNASHNASGRCKNTCQFNSWIWGFIHKHWSDCGSGIEQSLTRWVVRFPAPLVICVVISVWCVRGWMQCKSAVSVKKVEKWYIWNVQE